MSFNWKIYRELNQDLVKAGLNDQDKLSKHYLLHAKADKRLYSIYQLYPDFNPIIYREKYGDLKNMSNEQLELHWIKNGRYEKRNYNNSIAVNSIPNNSIVDNNIANNSIANSDTKIYKFNWKIYRELNPDLVKAGLNDQNKLSKHYLQYAKSDKRVYSIYQLYPDFNPITYREKYGDLKNMSNEDLELHWIKNGRYENRSYSTSIECNIIGNIYNNINSIFYNTLEGYPKVNGNKTIISLSSIPNRIITNDFDKVIDSLFNQHIKVYKIVVNICHNYRRNFIYDKEQLQDKINYLTNKYDNLIFNYSEDYGPITKILGLYNSGIELTDEDRVIVVDDDWCMNSNMTYYYEYVYQLYNCDGVFINERDIINWDGFVNIPQSQIFYDNYQNFVYGWLSFSMKYKFIKKLYDFYNKHVNLDESLWKHDDLLITVFYKQEKLYACGMNLFFYDKNNRLKIDNEFALRNDKEEIHNLRKKLENKILDYFGYKYIDKNNHTYIVNNQENVSITKIQNSISKRELLFCVNNVQYDIRKNDFQNKQIDIKYFNKNTMIITITYFDNIVVNDTLYLGNNTISIKNNNYSRKVSYFVNTYTILSKFDNNFNISVFQTYKRNIISLKCFYSISTILANTPNISYEFFNDVSINKYLDTKNKLFNKIMNTLKPGAYKADMFRLIKLYYDGGIYFDSKMILYKPLDNILINNDKVFVRDISGGIYNAFMYCKNACNKHIENALIKLIFNVINNLYGEDFLSITGPNMLKNIITENIIMKNNIESDIEWKRGYLTHNNEIFIKNSYPGYYDENNYLALEHYTVLWNNKDVFLPLDYTFVYNKINYISRILWINLDRSTNRKTYVENILKNINVPNTRVSAIDGKNNITNMYNIKTGNMSNYEIACTLSHIKAINMINTEEGEYSMIMEDDILFDNFVFFNNDLETIIRNAPQFDILLIHIIYNKELQTYTSWNTEFNKGPEHHIASTAAYIISKSGINRIKQICNYSNNYFNFSINTLDNADKFIYNNCNTWVYKYNIIDTVNNESEIHSDHIQWHKITSDLNKNIIIRDAIKNII